MSNIALWQKHEHSYTQKSRSENIIMPDNRESVIIINGHKLSDAQSMTVRVAIESFASHLVNVGLGDDEHGLAMKNSYLNCINEIRTIIFS